MARVNKKAINKHILSAGMSGSGKSWFIEQKINKDNPKRLLIWDVSDEWGDITGIKRVSTVQELYAELVKNTTGKYRLVCTESDLNYKAFNKLALAWGNWDMGEVVVVIEESGSVSNSGKAPEGEYQLITKGRKYGVVVCYIVQTFADGSKTALKNIPLLRIGLTEDGDINGYIRRRWNKELADKVASLRD